MVPQILKRVFQVSNSVLEFSEGCPKFEKGSQMFNRVSQILNRVSRIINSRQPQILKKVSNLLLGCFRAGPKYFIAAILKRVPQVSNSALEFSKGCPKFEKSSQNF